MLGHGASIVRNGLVLQLDAANTKSYPGSGTVWNDLSGNGNHFTITGTGFSHNSVGYFDMTTGNIYQTMIPTQATNCTCVFWIKTTDTQSLFLTTNGSTNVPYLGAYRVGNKYYNSGVGTPTYHQDTIARANIYDNLIDGAWHMVEFKNVDFSTWTSIAFSQYPTFIFNSGSVASISIYNRTLTDDESKQNFNALRGRYGI